MKLKLSKSTKNFILKDFEFLILKSILNYHIEKIINFNDQANKKQKIK